MIANRDGRTDPVARSVPSVPETGPTVITRALMAAVTGYRRFISPLLPPRCRFEPSCSRYAVACLESHGASRGVLLSLVRVCKCHPFHPGGYDPPPESSRGWTGPQGRLREGASAREPG